jgi:ubiquinone/menaquinone biosynthesis C-methylase UbiE
MRQLLAGLRAAGEETRLRILHLLSLGEFNVSELTKILGQSQPRVSRHLKLMTEAGLLERFKEGSWVLFRMREDGRGADVASAIVQLVSESDATVQRDLVRVREILRARRELAERFFEANARNWDEIRSLHVSEKQVEKELVRLIGGSKVESGLDIGTGTGAILELLAPLCQHATGIDASRQMLAIARARIEESGLKNAQVRHGDLFSLPFEDESVDLVTIHQVLHFLSDPGGALEEAGRVIKPGGRLAIVDFAPHDLEFLREEQAHRRLGIAQEDTERWALRAGLQVTEHRSLAAPDGKGLTVFMWLCEKG